MMRDFFATMPRAERRAALTVEQRARKSGKWGAWETFNYPAGIGGAGWLNEVRKAHRNRVFAVLERPVRGKAIHLAVTSLSQIRPSWPEMQRIKNEIAGVGATAVEVYPPQGEVIDEADMYHLWVLPGPLWFSLHPKADQAFAGSIPGDAR